jgi:hypothetical protein
MGYQFKKSDIVLVPDVHRSQLHSASPFFGRVAGNPARDGRSIETTKLGRYKKTHRTLSHAVTANYTPGEQTTPNTFTTVPVASAERHAIKTHAVKTSYGPTSAQIDFLTLSLRESKAPILPIRYH